MQVAMESTGLTANPGADSVDADAVREELAGYYLEMESFREMQPKDILMRISSWSARVNHIRMHLIKIEDRSLAILRTKTIDPFLSECQFQFKVWSRLLSAEQLEWEQSKGY